MPDARQTLVIVVVQLVLALRMHALRPLTLVPCLRGPHGHVTGSGGMGGRKRKLAFQRSTLALRTHRRFLATDESLEVVATVLAGVFVDRYDGIPGGSSSPLGRDGTPDDLA